MREVRHDERHCIERRSVAPSERPLTVN